MIKHPLLISCSQRACSRNFEMRTASKLAGYTNLVMFTPASTIRLMHQQQQEQTWTVRRLLEWTSGFFSRKGVDPARLSAELLLAHVLNVPRIKLYTDYERPLSDEQLSQFRELVRRA